MFRQLRGHEWKANDEMLRFLYRAEGFLKGLGARMQLLTRKDPA